MDQLSDDESTCSPCEADPDLCSDRCPVGRRLREEREADRIQNLTDKASERLEAFLANKDRIQKLTDKASERLEAFLAKKDRIQTLKKQDSEQLQTTEAKPFVKETERLLAKQQSQDKRPLKEPMTAGTLRYKSYQVNPLTGVREIVDIERQWRPPVDVDAPMYNMSPEILERFRV